MSDNKPTPRQLFLAPLKGEIKAALSLAVPDSFTEKNYLLEALQESLSLLTQRLNYEFSFPTEPTFTLAANNAYNSANNLIHAVYAFAKSIDRVKISTLDSNMDKLNQLLSLTYPRGFKISAAEKDETNQTADKLDFILTDYTCSLDQIRKHYVGSEIPVGEEAFADKLTETLKHLHSLVYQLKTKQKLPLSPAKIIKDPEVNIESKYDEVSSPIEEKMQSIEAQFSAIGEILETSKESIQKIYSAPPVEEKENPKIDINLIRERYRAKSDAKKAKMDESLRLENKANELKNALYRQFDTGNLVTLRQARTILEKEHKAHIANEINDIGFEKLSSALELKDTNEQYIKNIFEQFQSYSKEKLRFFVSSEVKNKLRENKVILLEWINNAIEQQRIRLSLKTEFAPYQASKKVIEQYAAEIATLSTEMAKLADDLNNNENYSNVSVATPIKNKPLLKEHSDLSSLLNTATNLTSLLKKLRKNIDAVLTIEEKHELSMHNIADVMQSLNQIQIDIKTAKSQMTELNNAAKQYQNSYPSEDLASSLPLNQLQEALAQTSNLIDFKKQEEILNSIVENNNIEIARTEKLSETRVRYQDALKTEKEKRTILARLYIGKEQALDVESELGSYLEKRNRKYAYRDAFFTCFPGSERAKRTAYLNDLSVLIKSYTEDDFKKGDEPYLKLKEFIEQGIKKFKPRSSTSQESLKSRLDALLFTITENRKTHLSTIGELRNELPKSSSMRKG